MTTPEALIVGGPNGAGETTFVRGYLGEDARPYLSADAIAAELNPTHPEAEAVAAGRAFLRELDRRIEARQGFVVETTLAGRGFRRAVERMQAAGFHVSLVFIFLPSPEMHVERVRQRVHKGGHHVPEEDVVRRFYRSKRNFWHVYRPQVDEWHLFTNTSEGFEEVAAGNQSTEQVYVQPLFEQFFKGLETN